MNGVLRGRRGARIAALTSGGAIPDTADYDVVAEPDDTLVGPVDEDFAIESMAGDVFLLGTTSWRIRRVEAGVVRVEDAHGAPPPVPFWLGEAPARTAELSARCRPCARGDRARRGDPRRGGAWLAAEAALAAGAAEQLVRYLAATRRALGVVPTQPRSSPSASSTRPAACSSSCTRPSAARINRALGPRAAQALLPHVRLRAAGRGHRRRRRALARPAAQLPARDGVRASSRRPRSDEVLAQAVLAGADVRRALALERDARARSSCALWRGKRVPPPIQRMRADDLLAAVFPAQVACQDNAPGPDRAPRPPARARRRVRDCLHEAMDVDGLAALLDGGSRGARPPRSRARPSRRRSRTRS